MRVLCIFLYCNYNAIGRRGVSLRVFLQPSSAVDPSSCETKPFIFFCHPSDKR